MITGLSDLAQVTLATVTAFALTLALVPVAMRLAVRTQFFDRPQGYKEHEAPTPYLGGLAVIGATCVAAILFAGALDEYAVLLVGALFLCAVGTIDDRLGLGIYSRLAAQVAVAVALWASDLGWQFLPSAGDLALDVLWVVGLVNAFNLLDNLDGAMGTVAGVSSGGAGVLALIQDQPELAAFAFALAGSCVAFLRYNLAAPARIFLGDGGSMPIGFLLAAIVATLPNRPIGLENLLAVVPIVGLAILDTTLVVTSRIRRGVSVLRGGRDHLTHRLLDVVGTPQRVALVIGIAQAIAAGAGILLYGAPETVIAWTGAAYVLAASAGIALMEAPWGPRRPQSAEQST